MSSTCFEEEKWIRSGPRLTAAPLPAQSEREAVKQIDQLKLDSPICNSWFSGNSH